MILAATMLLLAQAVAPSPQAVVPSSSPQPVAPSFIPPSVLNGPYTVLNGAKAVLTLSEALKRLIPDAPDGFAMEVGTKIAENATVLAYALKFRIAGLTDCAVVKFDFDFATCIGYRGDDSTAALSAYDTLEAALQRFAANDVPLEEAGTNANGVRLTTATYYANHHTAVMVEMVQTRQHSVVVLTVRPIASL